MPCLVCSSTVQTVGMEQVEVVQWAPSPNGTTGTKSTVHTALRCLRYGHAVATNAIESILTQNYYSAGCTTQTIKWKCHCSSL